jgi:hypothetical protein
MSNQLEFVLDQQVAYRPAEHFNPSEVYEEVDVAGKKFLVNFAHRHIAVAAFDSYDAFTDDFGETVGEKLGDVVASLQRLGCEEDALKILCRHATRIVSEVCAQRLLPIQGDEDER